MDRKSIQNLIENRIRTEKKKYENTRIDWIKLAALKAGANIDQVLHEEAAGLLDSNGRYLKQPVLSNVVITDISEGPLWGGSDFGKDDESTLQNKL